MYGFSEMMMEEAEKQFSQEGRKIMTMTSEEKLAISEAIHAMKWLDKHCKGWGLEEECAILESICSNYEKKEIQSNHNYLDLQYQLDGAESEIERLRDEINIIKKRSEHNALQDATDARIQMIELLAAGEHDQWAAWAQSILDSEPGLSEGRKAAWPGMIATPYENLSEELKDKDRREVHLRSSVALDIVQQQAARIKELEDALKVEKAWTSQYQEWLIEEVAEGMSENGYADDDLRQQAKDSLLLDGKIGPDAGIASSDHIVEADQTVGGRRCHI